MSESNTIHSNNKKFVTICRLLEATFPNVTFGFSEDERIALILKGGSYPLSFIYLDTWNMIKSKVKKLLKTDGICIICFEEVNGWNVPCCSEIICKSCLIQIDIYKCPNCRQDISHYYRN